MPQNANWEEDSLLSRDERLLFRSGWAALQRLQRILSGPQAPARIWRTCSLGVEFQAPGKFSAILNDVLFEPVHFGCHSIYSHPSFAPCDVISPMAAFSKLDAGRQRPRKSASKFEWNVGGEQTTNHPDKASKQPTNSQPQPNKRNNTSSIST